MSAPSTPGAGGSRRTDPDAAADVAEVTSWAITAARAAASKQGTDTVVMRVGQILGITELFVVTSVSNTRLVRAITDEVEHQVAASGGPRPRRVEGLDDLRWALLDYGDFVVHVFLDEARRFYDLDRLWADVERVEWEDASASGDAEESAES